MLAKVVSGATVGLDSIPVEVEVHLNKKGLPSFKIVGLPDKAVEEAKERVRSAIVNSGANFPKDKITINLAPADLPKEGPAYDLPIAVGMLIADKQIEGMFEKTLMLGELSLDGALRHTNGALPMALLARKQKIDNLFLPAINSKEAAVVDKISVYPLRSLRELIRHLRGVKKIRPCPTTSLLSLTKKTDELFDFDFADIKGQESAKKALTIAAAGGHNAHLTGAPGAGKTMLARAYPSILPPLTSDEALEITKIYSITGNIPQGESIIRYRPFRSPHHTTSRIGLIGGGSKPMPGEISLAHRGVLFLDEFPEYPRHVLESIRQPLEDGLVTISRAKGSVTYPANFRLIAASNPCPCGYYGSKDNNKRCRCAISEINRYKKKISGPINDRIDLHINCPALSPDEIDSLKSGPDSQSIRKKVISAQRTQIKRFKNTTIKSNSDMSSKLTKEVVRLDNKSRKFLRQAINNLDLSARSYFKVLKVARTIADINNQKEVNSENIAEALLYRAKDSNNLII